LDSVAIIAAICQRYRIASVRYFESELPPPIQDAVPSGQLTAKLVSEALSIRASTGMQFTEALLLTVLRGRRPSAALIKAIGRHYSNDLKTRKVSRNPLRILRRIVADRPATKMVVLTSEVTLSDGRKRHLPMLDLRYRPSPTHQQTVLDLASAMGVEGGYLVLSGGSYHLYGSVLLTPTQWRRFLGRALLYAPIVDRAWIAHQLIEGYSALRISPKPNESAAPQVIAKVTSQ